jgi:hypothetical protein
MTSQVDINEYAEGAVLLDGLEEAIIGIVEEFGNGRRLLYSKSKILSILCERDLMTMGEAEEFYDYNIVGLHAGEQNAVFLDLDIIKSFVNMSEFEDLYKIAFLVLYFSSNGVISFIGSKSISE